MTSSEKKPAPRPVAVVAWAIDAPLPRDQAEAVSGNIPLLRLLAEACDAVTPVPATSSDDVLSWTTPAGAPARFRIALEAPRRRINGYVEADVEVRGDEAVRRRIGIEEWATRRIAMRIRTRIPLGENVRDHVTDRTLPLIGAYARACADALEGSLPVIDERDLQTALALRLHAAHAAHVAVEGNDPDRRWVRHPRDIILIHRGESPLDPEVTRVTNDIDQMDLEDAGIPPTATIGFDDEGFVTIRRTEVLSFLSDDTGEAGGMATLRAVAALEEALGRGGA